MLAIEQRDEWWVGRRYLCEDLLPLAGRSRPRPLATGEWSDAPGPSGMLPMRVGSRSTRAAAAGRASQR
jgi:hypothetical protein